MAVSFSVVSIACAQENSAPIASLGDVIESLEINTQYAAETVELVNNAGDKLIISGPEDGENAVQKFAQLQYLFEAA